MYKKSIAIQVAIFISLSSNPVFADSSRELAAVRAEIQELRTSYEKRIATLEAKLEQLEESTTGTAQADEGYPTTETGVVPNNTFNPAISLFFNGQYSQFSADTGEIAGFATGHEGERPREGFAMDHTETNVQAYVDDKFMGSATVAVAQHEEKTELELEEAYFETLSELGLPTGMTIKTGRAFWTLGYLNEHHTHTDDFVDRPLPHRVFLNGAYNDDGLEISYVLPTSFYTEIGGGVFRGDDFPYGGASGEGFGAWSAFLRTGGDLRTSQSWRLGGYVLTGDADTERWSSEDKLSYQGETELRVLDFRYSWAPTNNAGHQEVTLQGEYFRRAEDGTYEDVEAGTGMVDVDQVSSGWYAQGVYRMSQNWRLGLRYSGLKSPDVMPGLAGTIMDSEGHNPNGYSAMGDWSNSEFSRIRLQYNREELAGGQEDDQVVLQYIMSLGAHAAHKY